MKLLKITKDRIKEFLKLDDMYTTMYNDGYKSLRDAVIPMSEIHLWLVLCDPMNDVLNPIGLFYLQAHTPTLFEIHFGIYKQYRGSKTLQYLKEFAALFDTNYIKNAEFITFIPSNKQHSHNLAINMGFKEIYKTQDGTKAMIRGIQ